MFFGAQTERRHMMSRYIREIDLQLPENEVRGLMDRFLKENGFYRGEWKGQTCWTADYGMNKPATALKITGVYFFDYTYENGRLHFEAWVRDGKKKETGLTGWYNWQMKAPYTGLVAGLEKKLINELPQDSELRLQAGDSIQIEDNKRRMDKARLILGAICLLFFMNALFNVLKHVALLGF